MHGSEKVKGYMHRKEFVSEFARRTGLSEEAANEATMTFLEILSDSWSVKRPVCFMGFGLFDIRPVSERMARNPITMEDAVVPAGYKPVFKVSKGFRASLNKTIQEKMENAAPEGEKK